MNIIFKGRRTDVQERFRKHAEAKLGKIGKLEQKTIKVDVEVSQERNPRQSGRRERVELTIRSRGPVIRAEAAADDRYVALDRALAKLEERLRRTGDRRKAARHGALAAGRAPVVRPGAAPVMAEVAEAAALAGPADGYATALGPGNAPGAGVLAQGLATAAETGDAGDYGAGRPAAGTAEAGIVPIQMEGEGPVVVREKFHAATPMSVDQALLEMELVGHDFFLFRDDQSGLPSVVYRRHGYQYGLIRLVESAPAQMAAGQREEGVSGSAVGG